MTNNPSVAVVILNYNGKEHLETFLPSVVQSGYKNLQIIVGDNASNDGSIGFIQAHYPEIRIIQNKQNYGFAGGYNEVLKQVEADYFILLNSDVLVSPGWIGPLIELMQSDRQIGACQPKIKAYLQQNYFEYAGAAGGFIDKWGYPFCRGRIFDTLEQDDGQYDDEKEIFWASGACLVIRSQLYKEMGGLDADFFAHMEEIDLCWRLKNSGYKIMYCPRSSVYHVGGGTLDNTKPFKTYLNFRNNLILLQKNLPALHALWLISIRFVLDLIAIFKFISEKKWAHAKAVSKAHRYFIAHQVQLIKKSRKIPINRLHKNTAGWYRKSIVFNYFIQKKHCFSQLDPVYFNDK